MKLVKTFQKLPAPELDSFPVSSSPDSSFPEAGFILDESLPEAGSIPDESSPDADSIPDKFGKIKWTVIVNNKYIKVHD